MTQLAKHNGFKTFVAQLPEDDQSLLKNTSWKAQDDQRSVQNNPYFLSRTCPSETRWGVSFIISSSKLKYLWLSSFVVAACYPGHIHSCHGFAPFIVYLAEDAVTFPDRVCIFRSALDTKALRPAYSISRLYPKRPCIFDLARQDDGFTQRLDSQGHTSGSHTGHAL
ncbi:MAG: hypothetical protein MZV70_16260 [Desulfobacterales bacterium]|nr:hypothetical protein [Desulfobacterales bacterium]